MLRRVKASGFQLPMVIEGGGGGPVFSQTMHTPVYFAHFGTNTLARTSGRDWTLSQDVLIADAESPLLVSEEHQQVRQANLQHRQAKANLRLLHR